VISAQQLPRPKDENGVEKDDKQFIDPFVTVSLHVPDWTNSPFLPLPATSTTTYSPPSNGSGSVTASSARTISHSTAAVKNNGFNPVWQEMMSIPFDCVGDLLDLIFVRFVVKDDSDDDNDLAVYCIPLGSLMPGKSVISIPPVR
jgi:phosphatidylinositol phospholipase C, delta